MLQSTIVTPARVLHVINKVASHGGAEVSLNDMLLRLQQLGVDNVIVGLKGGNDADVESQLASAGVVVYPPLGSLGPRAAWELVRIIRAEQPDVVHTSLFEADFWGRIAAFMTRTPVLVSVVNTQYSALAYSVAPSPRRLRIAQALDALLARRLTSTLHAISRATADAAAAAYGISADSIVVIPRGRAVPDSGRRTHETRMSARQRSGLPSDAEIILNVARVELQKGQTQLVEAFARVAAVRPEALLVIAGRPGNASAAVAARARDLKIDSRVLMLGARRDVADLLEAADVFVFSSLWEGLGGSVLEAMAREVPVVAFDVPAVREATGSLAALVDVGDSEALGEAVIRFLSDPKASAETAVAARRRVQAHFDPDKVAQAMAQLYGAMAARGRPAAPLRSRHFRVGPT